MSVTFSVQIWPAAQLMLPESVVTLPLVGTAISSLQALKTTHSKRADGKLIFFMQYFL
jgi:hypothetical protein